MKKLCFYLVPLFSSLIFGHVSAAQVTSAHWQTIQLDNYQLAKSPVQTTRAFRLNSEGFQPLAAGESNIEIDLPLPDGQFVRIVLSPSKVMSAALAEKYPNIKTYSGYQLNAPQNKVTVDVGPHGFHGVIEQGQKTVYIDPVEKNNRFEYISYYRDDEDHSKHNPSMLKPNKKAALDYRVVKALTSAKAKKAKSSDHQLRLRTLRIAIAATGEYSQFHGGTKEKVLASLVTLVNRINQVYRKDMALQFELVANNDEIIFLDAGSDPFQNTDDDIDFIQYEIDSRISPSDYDIGHLVTTGGGGLASLESVCTDYKAQGVTGSDTPINDAFYIDYVAHEIGHQLGAEHIFNGNSGGCFDNRESGSAYEPGSGNSIMGYAGLCDEQDIALSTDAHFHIHSIEQMQQALDRAPNCGIIEATDTVLPQAYAGQDYTIPARTPFELNAYKTSQNPMGTTYSWYQMDLGEKTENPDQDYIDDGKRPLFKSFLPTVHASRSFPQLSDVLSGKLSYGETYATQNRELNFRLVVRDNQGNLDSDHVRLDVVETEQGFTLNQPSTKLPNELHLTWHTANTENEPVSCPKVTILLSIDGGETFKHTLAESIANDGEHTVSLSGISTQQGRVKIACSNNVFYAINPTNLHLDAPVIPKTDSINNTLEQQSQSPQGNVANNASQPQAQQTSVNTQSTASNAKQSRGGGSIYWLLTMLITALFTRRVMGLGKLTCGDKAHEDRTHQGRAPKGRANVNRAQEESATPKRRAEVMKYNHKALLLTLPLILLGCAKANEAPTPNNSFSDPAPVVLTQDDIAEQVEKHLANAIQKGDYRLFASAGRRTLIVGIDYPNLTQLKQQCGIKFMPLTGDVLTGVDDIKVRNLQLKFARRYNKRMYPYCLNNKG